MTPNISIQKATALDIPEVAIMVGELLDEIMAAIGIPAFHFNLEETTLRLQDFIAGKKYFVFVAKDQDKKLVGFITLYESYALYAEGAFGTIPELYVRPGFKSQSIGQRLIEQAKSFGRFTRLETVGGYYAAAPAIR